jgi:hypothetical protein
MTDQCSVCRRYVCLHLYPGLAYEKPYWLKTEAERRQVTFVEPIQDTFVFAPYVPIMPKKP